MRYVIAAVVGIGVYSSIAFVAWRIVRSIRDAERAAAEREARRYEAFMKLLADVRDRIDARK